MTTRVLIIAFWSVLLSLSAIISDAQELRFTDILNEEKLIDKNVIEKFIDNDFSGLWLQSEHVLGIIGDDYQRIRVKMLSVVKNENNPEEYLVYGKTMVRSNSCEFIGKITIRKIQETARDHFGVDDEYAGMTKTQGLITASYELFEDKRQKHTGMFSGELKTKWYLDNNNEIHYDDINSIADAYFNNSFVGIWKGYNSAKSKICNWADYRVPSVKLDFDIGAGGFSPDETYANAGWDNYIKMLSGDKQAEIEEQEEWWK